MELAHDLGISIDALSELTSGCAVTFNQECRDLANVRYVSYAGSGRESAILKPAHLYCEFVGATADTRVNDGLVPLASARWGEFIEPSWPTDHLGEVGYNLNIPPFASHFDHLAAFRAVVDRVAA